MSDTGSKTNNRTIDAPNVFITPEMTRVLGAQCQEQGPEMIVYICLCMYVCVCVYIYIYIYI